MIQWSELIFCLIMLEEKTVAATPVGRERSHTGSLTQIRGCRPGCLATSNRPIPSKRTVQALLLVLNA